jgi:hypothetical protein
MNSFIKERTGIRKVEPTAGIEPATCSLRMSCSTS